MHGRPRGCRYLRSFQSRGAIRGAPGAGRADPQPVVDAIRAAVSRHHGLLASDVRLVAAGSIPRTTSGKLARRACRAQYLEAKPHHGQACMAQVFAKTLLLQRELIDVDLALPEQLRIPGFSVGVPVAEEKP